jgi:hypothetical protein
MHYYHGLMSTRDDTVIVGQADMKLVLPQKADKVKVVSGKYAYAFQSHSLANKY